MINLFFQSYSSTGWNHFNVNPSIINISDYKSDFEKVGTRGEDDKQKFEQISGVLEMEGMFVGFAKLKVSSLNEKSETINDLKDIEVKVSIYLIFI